jgi:hypothetical protein
MNPGAITAQNGDELVRPMNSGMGRIHVVAHKIILSIALFFISIINLPEANIT